MTDNFKSPIFPKHAGIVWSCTLNHNCGSSFQNVSTTFKGRLQLFSLYLKQVETHEKSDKDRDVPFSALKVEIQNSSFISKRQIQDIRHSQFGIVTQNPISARGNSKYFSNDTRSTSIYGKQDNSPPASTTGGRTAFPTNITTFPTGNITLFARSALSVNTMASNTTNSVLEKKTSPTRVICYFGFKQPAKTEIVKDILKRHQTQSVTHGMLFQPFRQANQTNNLGNGKTQGGLNWWLPYLKTPEQKTGVVQRHTDALPLSSLPQTTSNTNPVPVPFVANQKPKNIQGNSNLDLDLPQAFSKEKRKRRQKKRKTRKNKGKKETKFEEKKEDLNQMKSENKEEDVDMDTLEEYDETCSWIFGNHSLNQKIVEDLSFSPFNDHRGETPSFDEKEKNENENKSHRNIEKENPCQYILPNRDFRNQLCRNDNGKAKISKLEKEKDLDSKKKPRSEFEPLGWTFPHSAPTSFFLGVTYKRQAFVSRKCSDLSCDFAFSDKKKCELKDKKHYSEHEKSHPFQCTPAMKRIIERQNRLTSTLSTTSTLCCNQREKIIQLEKENNALKELKKEEQVAIDYFLKYFKKEQTEIQDFLHHFSLPPAEEDDRTWEFCTIGENCKTHFCQWQPVYREMNEKLNKHEQFIILRQHGVEYAIDYFEEDKSSEVKAIQTQPKTNYVRGLRWRLNVERHKKIERRKKFQQIFNSSYWIKCSRVKIPEVEPYADIPEVEPYDSLWNLFEHQSGVEVKNMKMCLIFNRASFEAFKLRSVLWSKGVNRILFLFHGLKNSNSLDAIVRDGFQLHFSNPGYFSRGFYFSESFAMCFEHYATPTKNELTGSNVKTVLLCAVNVGNPFVSAQTRSWNQDEPCMHNGKLLHSVQFEHFGATSYVVPLNQQVHALAAFQYTS